MYLLETQTLTTSLLDKIDANLFVKVWGNDAFWFSRAFFAPWGLVRN